MNSKTYHITLNGKVYEVEIEEVNKGDQTNPKVQEKTTKTISSTGERIEAPMPGTIVNILVNKGDVIKKGQVIAILEAMKMENEIVAPIDGTVISIDIEKGQNVNLGDILVKIG